MLKKVMKGRLDPDNFFTFKQILTMNAGFTLAVLRFAMFSHRHEWKGFRNASNGIMKMFHAIKSIPMSLVISTYHVAALSAVVPADIIAFVVHGTYKGGVNLVRSHERAFID